MRTSYAPGSAQVSWRDGYRVIRKAGRYLVFPRAAFSEMMGWHGASDGAGRDLERHAVLLAGVVPAHERRVAAPRARLDVGDDAAAALGAPRPHARVPGRAAAVPADADRHALGVVEGRDHRTKLRLPRRRTSPWCRPVSIRRFSPGGVAKSPTPLVVAVGRLVPVKRFDRADRSARRRFKRTASRPAARDRGRGVRTRHPRAPDRRARRDRVDLAWPGTVDDAEALLDLYRQAWVLASASAHEGWGMTITEAAACGTPAVATRIAGHSDAIVDGTTGVLVDDDAGAGARARPAALPTMRSGRCSPRTHSSTPRCSRGRATARGTLEVLAAEALRHPSA